MTEWFHEDDECWIAECEACYVPMVVWKRHDNAPPDDVKTRLHERLAMVVHTHFEYEHYVDDNMRQIPEHYHAHARPKGAFYGHGLKRKQV